MNKLNFNQFSKNFKSFFDIDRSKIELNFKRDWLLAVLTFVLFLILSGAVHFYIYRDLVIKSEKLGGQQISTTSLDLQTINSLTNEFKTKEAQFNSYMTNKPDIVDPSR